MSRFDSIDFSTLITVHGGQEVTQAPSTDGLNTDVTSSRLGVWLLGGRIPIPYKVSKSRSTRTDFGWCVDQSAASCKRIGGGDAAVGACRVEGIDLCTKQQ